MGYTKNDAKMTQGLAIVCMVVLHLFCRQGADVFGTPLVWLNDTTPFVYWFGFFAEICVPLYAMCMGYAQELLYENGKSRFSSRLKRIGTLMLNYWVILAIFSIVGLIADPSGGIPGSFLDFVKAAVLIKSYNGAWWFLHTYVILLLIPPTVLLFPVRKLSWWACVGLSGVVYGGMYLWGKLGSLSAMTLHPIVEFCADEAVNAISVLPYVWVGALMCKYAFVVQVQKLRDNIIPKRLQKPLLMTAIILLFVVTNVVHKALMIGPVSVLVFLLFNVWKKSRPTTKVMLFLGEHSTNIWLVHMFFYAYIFVGLVEIVRYPLAMLVFMFALCIATSYVVKGMVYMCNIVIRKFGLLFAKKRLYNETK